MAEAKLLAAVSLKGTVKVHKKPMDTLKKLRVTNTNMCVVVPSDETHRGMLLRASEFLAWGEITGSVLERLLEKRGGMQAKDAKALAKKAFSGGLKGEKLPVFRLSPPSGGIRNIRMGFPRGDMGYRGAQINDLIERMV